MASESNTPSPAASQPGAGSPSPAPKKRRRYVPAVTPGLKKLLGVVFALFALLGMNAVYLLAISLMERSSGRVYQNYFFTAMFGLHLVLGVGLILPLVIFGALHIKNAWDRPNKNAVRMGYALFTAALLLLASGIVLTSFDAFGFEFDLKKNPTINSVAYWVHVIAPVAVIWLFILHRMAGPKIKWRVGAVWAGVAGLFALGMVAMHAQDPRAWNVEGPESGEQYFFPSLARTATGNFIPAKAMMMDQYCVQCHEDVHADWSNSVHRFSSFNNPAYLASVRGTRAVALERDGDVQASRFCAGCHDPVPFFSGAFDDPDFDDVNHPTAQAGITCTSCHAITHVNSQKGNSDFTIEEPIHYPFAYSEMPFLRWVNRQLVKAKPEFHKKTFLKPLHQTAEFCGACHKVHLPVELNKYKWLRGQNHYDAYHLSGVSGHGVTSFYYPPAAQENCNGCHMPLAPSDDFASRDFDDSGELQRHTHQFPSANTAIPYLLGLGDEAIQAHHDFNEGVLRLDLFGIKEGGTIEGELTAPLRPHVPALQPGRRYLMETIIRTVKMGHLFTQGTADSNEVWLEMTLLADGEVVGKSGGLRAEDRAVDPWSHFVNAYVLDRAGNRIARRNAEDIFVPLYNHQIPPGAADVIHYAFTVPEGTAESLEVVARLQYRKFDTTYMRFFQGDEFETNDLPIMTLAEDRLVFPVGEPEGALADATPPEIPLWQRWNDYGIGLLRKGDEGPNRGELRQAEEAFQVVEDLGRPDGPLNRARVYIKEGRLDEAVEALALASSHDPPAPPWTVSWFNGLVNKQNGYLDEAIESFRAVIEIDNEETRRRGFDFSQDYRVLAELGQTLFERAKQERGEARRTDRELFLRQAQESFEAALALDPEMAQSHFNLGQILEELGETERAAEHRRLHALYKPDDNARDQAIAKARLADPAANHAAEAIVIYDLQRPGAYALPDRPNLPARPRGGSE